MVIEGHTSLKFIYDVLYVPEINQNLLIVTQLLEIKTILFGIWHENSIAWKPQ